jgi:hypothetical protein
MTSTGNSVVRIPGGARTSLIKLDGDAFRNKFRSESFAPASHNRDGERAVISRSLWRFADGRRESERVNIRSYALARFSLSRTAKG